MHTPLHLCPHEPQARRVHLILAPILLLLSMDWQLTIFSKVDQNKTLAEKPPLAVLHMGPQKTGTTSIQKALLDIYPETLNKDGWDGRMVNNQKIKKIKWAEKTIMGCIKQKTSCNEHRWYSALNTTVQVSRRGKNLLISDEAMASFDFVSSRFWKQFSSLLKESYQLRAILVYRRYFEWLPSYYYQQFKFEGRPHGLQVLKWPAEGGIATPPLTEYWNQVLNNTHRKGFPNPNEWDEESMMPIHIVLNIKKHLEAQSIPVTVINYHSGNLLENFFCSALPHAPQTCQKIKKGVSIRSNRSDKSIHFDIIALAAKAAGLLRDNVSRNRAKGHIKRYLDMTNQTLKDLPLKCLKKSRENLMWEISYQAEEQLMPSLLPSFKASFAKAIKERKFCNVDTTILLRNPTWRRFLSSLEV